MERLAKYGNFKLGDIIRYISYDNNTMYGTISKILNDEYIVVEWEDGKKSNKFRIINGIQPIYIVNDNITPLSKLINKIYEEEKNKL